LKDKGHFPARLSDPLLREGDNILTLKKNLPVIGPVQSEDTATNRRLSTTALADKTQGFTPFQLEGDPVNGFYVRDLFP
jgi:hypothetical protein